MLKLLCTGTRVEKHGDFLIGPFRVLSSLVRHPGRIALDTDDAKAFPGIESLLERRVDCSHVSPSAVIRLAGDVFWVPIVLVQNMKMAAQFVVNFCLSLPIMCA